jgi:hypothetical protein
MAEARTIVTINADGSSAFNAARGVIPVKFTLSASGASTCALPPATIVVTGIDGATTVAIDESDYLLPADNGANFRIADCEYVYNLAASALGTGRYRVAISINGTVSATHRSP